jgi:hypothetical protein
MNEKDIIPSEVIEKRIFIIRGQKVMLDFLFELTLQEYTALRYQLGTLKRA